MGQQTKCPFHWCRKQVCSPRSHGGISMGRMRRALQQRLPVAAGAATLTVFLAAVILLPKTTSEILRDSAFDIELAGDQWLRRPAPSDLKVIVVDIDRASIDALGHLGGRPFADTARADRRGDRIEMPFAAAHESVVVQVFGCHAETIPTLGQPASEPRDSRRLQITDFPFRRSSCHIRMPVKTIYI